MLGVALLYAWEGSSHVVRMKKKRGKKREEVFPVSGELGRFAIVSLLDPDL